LRHQVPEDDDEVGREIDRILAERRP